LKHEEKDHGIHHHHREIIQLFRDADTGSFGYLDLKTWTQYQNEYENIFDEAEIK